MIPLPFRLFWMAGRAGRREFAIVQIVCVLTVGLAWAWHAGHDTRGAPLGPFAALVMLTFFAAMAAGAMTLVRRLQDIGEDPYLAFWILIVCWTPAVLAERFGRVGEVLAPWIMSACLIVAFIILWTRPSQSGANKYGPEPRPLK